MAQEAGRLPWESIAHEASMADRRAVARAAAVGPITTHPTDDPEKTSGHRLVWAYMEQPSPHGRHTDAGIPPPQELRFHRSEGFFWPAVVGRVGLEPTADGL